MAGGSFRHNALCVQTASALNALLRKRGCFALSSDTRVSLGERYVYPDVTVTCGERRFEPDAKDVLLNPVIVVEVLSAGTESYDRGLKWDSYQQIPSLTDYLLIAQSHVRVEQFQRSGAASWTYRSFGAGDRVTLSTGETLDVESIYADVFELEGE